MKKAKITSLILCGALMTLVGSFAWAKVITYESKTLKWEWKANGDQADGGDSTATPSRRIVIWNRVCG